MANLLFQVNGFSVGPIWPATRNMKRNSTLCFFAPECGKGVGVLQNGVWKSSLRLPLPVYHTSIIYSSRAASFTPSNSQAPVILSTKQFVWLDLANRPWKLPRDWHNVPDRFTNHLHCVFQVFCFFSPFRCFFQLVVAVGF